MKRNDGGLEAPVWDLPVRLFHWMLAGLFGLSWWSVEESYDQVHFWSGYSILFLLIFRILWGFLGSSTARFQNFVPTPSALFGYLRGEQHRHAGHTPLGALSVAAMLLALILQVATGLIQMDDEDFIEGPLANFVSYETAVFAHDVHEICFNILLGLIALHLLAIAYYQLVPRRALIRAMVTGQGDLPEGAPPMTSARKGRAIACLIAAFILVAMVYGASTAAA